MYLAKGLLYNLGFVIFLHAIQQLYWMFFLTTVYTCALLTYLPYRHRITINVDGMVCISILYCCTFKMWFAPRIDGDADDALSTVLIVGSFSPLLVGACVVLWMFVQLKSGHHQSGAQLQKDCNAFCKCLEELGNTHDQELRTIFLTVTEWDRWFIMQLVKLINGERALGIIGHTHRKTMTVGRSGSRISGMSDEAELQKQKSLNVDEANPEVYPEKGNGNGHGKGNGAEPQAAVQEMDSEMLLIRETHCNPRSSPRAMIWGPAWNFRK